MKKNTSSTDYFKTLKGKLMIAGLLLLLVFAFWPKSEEKKQETAPIPIPSPTPTPEMEIRLSDNTGKVLLVSKESEGVKLINGLFADIDPNKEENSYFTPFMKEKIQWVYDRWNAKKLELDPRARYAKNSDNTENTTTLMSSGYDDVKRPDVAQIHIFVPVLLNYIKLYRGIPEGFNREIKNWFAVMITHEATHLEKPPSYYLTPRSLEVSRQEENRAYFKVNKLAVRNLREKGEKVGPQLEAIDDMLKRCHDNPKCPEFVKFSDESVK